MSINRILLFIFLFVFYTAVKAQQDKSKDFINIKAPTIEYPTPDVEEIYQDEESGNTDESSAPVKDRNMYTDAEDSLYFDEDQGGELSLVEVDEQINMDSVWVTIASYYAIWDSRSVNPYKIDGANYKDTIAFVLYDTLQGMYYKMPLMYSKVNSRFGMRGYRWHYGTDLGLSVGDPVYACFDGIVRVIQYDSRGYGRYIVVRHYNGFETLYGHLSGYNVSVGQLVKAGDIIGKGGSSGRSTGPHLHFEVRYEGNAINPEYFFDFINHSIKVSNFELTPSHFAYLKEARKVFYHTIKSGETLGSISRKYRVSISQLCKLNGISTKTILRVGRKLRIR